MTYKKYYNSMITKAVTSVLIFFYIPLIMIKIIKEINAPEIERQLKFMLAGSLLLTAMLMIMLFSIGWLKI